MKCTNAILISVLLIIGGNSSLNAQSKETVTDIDGNVYHSVKIGKQVWMVENLKTTKFRNGDKIPCFTKEIKNKDADKIERDEFAECNTEIGYCYFNDDVKNKDIYGCLYNFMDVIDNRNIAPKGWHVPTQGDWEVLIEYLGGKEIAGGKLKETGTLHWTDSNIASTNETGFTALPSGEAEYCRYFSYQDKGGMASWWSSSEIPTNAGQNTKIWANHVRSVDGGFYTMQHGMDKFYAIRCIKD